MKYSTVRDQEQAKYSKLMTDCGVFWAFSNDQFKENKTALLPGEKYVSIGGGGYMPKHSADQFVKGMAAIEKWAKAAVKDATEVILYELRNYECFYTGDIADAMPRLTELGYTAAEVKKVYHSNREFALN